MLKILMMLHLKKLENGNYEIGIHIADVSYYLEEGTILDDEAINVTSVYLVDRVVPMLPEVSNFACSLRPQEEKYTFLPVLKFKKAEVLMNGQVVVIFRSTFCIMKTHIIETKDDTIPVEISITG
jgi:ribonuclease R